MTRTDEGGTVVGVFMTERSGEPLREVTAVRLEPGQGVVGDRYSRGSGTFSEKLKGSPDWEVTLIEAEEVDRYNASSGQSLSPGALRRNLVTRGVRLNDLVGQRFSVGGAQLEGIRLCEPCAYLASLLGPAIVAAMAHRAGLRARVISGATVRAGDRVVTAWPATAG